MGYSNSPATVEKIRPSLTTLESGQPCQWRVQPGEESRWAYKVREALAIARRHPQRFPALAQAATRFTIEIVTEGLVQARTALQTPQAEVLSGAVPTPVHGLELASSPERPLTVVGLSGVRDIISHWLRAQPTNTALTFPDAELTPAELSQLARFLRGRTPPWVVVAVPGVSVISLHPIGGDYPQSAVVPPEEPEPDPLSQAL